MNLDLLWTRPGTDDYLGPRSGQGRLVKPAEKRDRKFLTREDEQRNAIADPWDL